jgi:BlaI family penicillinase repressor
MAASEEKRQSQKGEKDNGLAEERGEEGRGSGKKAEKYDAFRIDSTKSFVDSPFMPAKTCRPTDAELRILEVLWSRGPSTVRRVFEQAGGAAGYTTVLKLMQIMLEKGLLTRDEKDRTHIYAAAVAEPEVKGGLVRELLEKAFGGSTKDLILQALSTKRSSRSELQEIRRMIEAMEKGKR